jgi:hypothetical protein
MKKCIHTKTQEEFNKVLEIFNSKNWRSWDSEDKGLMWVDYKENTCVDYHDRYAYTGKDIYEKNYKEYKIITFEEFLEEEGLWELPERWFILITDENRSILNDWKKTTGRRDDLFDYRYTLVGYDGGGGYTGWGYSLYPEITFEQFKKYVLKQNNMEEKEIIGYKLKEDCKQYEEAALKIMDTRWGDPKYLVTVDSVIDKLKKAGVLDLWFEPVYKEISFKLGDWIFCEGADVVHKIKDCKVEGSKLTFFCEIATPDCERAWPLSQIRLATVEEIKNCLIEEAKSRYPEGTRFRSLIHNDLEVIVKKFWHIDTDGRIWFEGVSYNGVVYTNGQWAEILTYPQITINGYKGEFHDSYISFGCARIDKRVFIELYQITEKGGNRDIEAVTIGKGTFSKDQIKEIAKYYLNK